MAKPFNGVINVDIRDSTPDWSPYLPGKAPEGSPNVLVVLYDDGDAVTDDYPTPPEFSGGRLVKVVFDVADDAYVDVERHLAAAMMRD